MALEQFTITRPADMHCHFRQGNTTKVVTPATAQNFRMAIAMPNTKPPITRIEQCREYFSEIQRANTTGRVFRPLMTAYVNEDLDPDELKRGFEKRVWVAAKLYPKGGTTGSEDAAESLRSVYPVFEAMQEIGMPLLIHGEVVGPEYNEHPRWQRETIFSAIVLPELIRDFPTLKKVCEHVSTRGLVQRVMRDESGYLAASITPHHALLADGDVARGGLWVDPNCMPMIKGPRDRAAIRVPMTLGDPRFFCGTDSAPWDSTNKYARCCSFGAFVAPGCIEVYAAIFEELGVFDQPDGVERFERFMSLNGPRFYGIEPAPDKLTLVRNTASKKITERFVIMGEKILEPDQEFVPLFHHELGFAPPFPFIVKNGVY